MNPKVVFRCFFISILLAAPTPLLLAGIVHLTNAPMADQWLAEAAFSVYAAVALGCFVMLFVGTIPGNLLSAWKINGPVRLLCKPKHKKHQQKYFLGFLKYHI